VGVRFIIGSRHVPPRLLHKVRERLPPPRNPIIKIALALHKTLAMGHKSMPEPHIRFATVSLISFLLLLIRYIHSGSVTLQRRSPCRPQ
jgi:hypothetical protein